MCLYFTDNDHELCQFDWEWYKELIDCENNRDYDVPYDEDLCDHKCFKQFREEGWYPTEPEELDRLHEWDYEKSHAALEVMAKKYERTVSARRFEEYLSLYHDRPVELLHIMSGINHGNGYAYQIFGYKFVKGESE